MVRLLLAGFLFCRSQDSSSLFGRCKLLTRWAFEYFDQTGSTSWLDGEHRLHVFLDSLDECLLRINSVASLLAEEFKKYPD